MAEPAMKQVEDIAIDSRLINLETNVEHIQQDLTEVKANVERLELHVHSDFKWLLGAFAAGFIMLLGAISTGYFSLNERQDKVLQEIHAISINVERIAASVTRPAATP